MNFEYLLYQYLLKHKKAEVPEFGVFEFTRESAKIDAANSVIIPPKESVTFEYHPYGYDDRFARYISEETSNDLSIVQTNLKKEIDNWLQKLQAEKILVLENLGQFQLDNDNKIIKTADNNEDVFGFEEVDLQHLKNLKSRNNFTAEYSFQKSVIWTFVSVIVIGFTALFLFGDQEIIFGKSSQIPVKQITRKPQAKETKTIIKQDSVKTDSIKPPTNAKIQKSNR